MIAPARKHLHYTTEAEAAEVRRLNGLGTPPVVIARMLGLYGCTVHRILNGTWHRDPRADQEVLTHHYRKTELHKCRGCGHRIEITPCAICAARKGKATGESDDAESLRYELDEHGAATVAKYRAVKQARGECQGAYLVSEEAA